MLGEIGHDLGAILGLEFGHPLFFGHPVHQTVPAIGIQSLLLDNLERMAGRTECRHFFAPFALRQVELVGERRFSRCLFARLSALAWAPERTCRGLLSAQCR